MPASATSTLSCLVLSNDNNNWNTGMQHNKGSTTFTYLFSVVVTRSRRWGGVTSLYECNLLTVD